MSMKAATAATPKPSTTAAHHGTPRKVPMIGRSSHASSASTSGSLRRSRVAVTGAHVSRFAKPAGRPSPNGTPDRTPLCEPQHSRLLSAAGDDRDTVCGYPWLTVDEHLHIGQIVHEAGHAG